MIPVYIKMAVIALWCGQPMNKVYRPGSDMVGESRAHAQVDACRTAVFQCLQAKTTILQAESCFMGTKLKE